MAKRDCQMMQARLALASGDRAGALSAAEEAVATAQSIKGSDAASSAYALSRGYRLLGDVKRSAGDSAGARAAWAAAFAALPKGAGERPAEMSEHATVLQRLGRRGESDQISAKLRVMGYIRPA
jgi:hypothetical protein